MVKLVVEEEVKNSISPFMVDKDKSYLILKNNNVSQSQEFFPHFIESLQNLDPKNNYQQYKIAVHRQNQANLHGFFLQGSELNSITKQIYDKTSSNQTVLLTGNQTNHGVYLFTNVQLYKQLLHQAISARSNQIIQSAERLVQEPSGQQQRNINKNSRFFMMLSQINPPLEIKINNTTVLTDQLFNLYVKKIGCCNQQAIDYGKSFSTLQKANYILNKQIKHYFKVCRFQIHHNYRKLDGKWQKVENEIMFKNLIKPQEQNLPQGEIIRQITGIDTPFTPIIDDRINNQWKHIYETNQQKRHLQFQIDLLKQIATQTKEQISTLNETQQKVMKLNQQYKEAINQAISNQQKMNLKQVLVETLKNFIHQTNQMVQTQKEIQKEIQKENQKENGQAQMENREQIQIVNSQNAEKIAQMQIQEQITQPAKIIYQEQNKAKPLTNEQIQQKISHLKKKNLPLLRKVSKLLENMGLEQLSSVQMQYLSKQKLQKEKSVLSSVLSDRYIDIQKRNLEELFDAMSKHFKELRYNSISVKTQQLFQNVHTKMKKQFEQLSFPETSIKDAKQYIKFRLQTPFKRVIQYVQNHIRSFKPAQNQITWLDNNIKTIQKALHQYKISLGGFLKDYTIPFKQFSPILVDQQKIIEKKIDPKHKKISEALANKFQALGIQYRYYQGVIQAIIQSLQVKQQLKDLYKQKSNQYKQFIVEMEKKNVELTNENIQLKKENERLTNQLNWN